MKTSFFFISLFLGQLMYGQCYENRHNTSLSSTWRSCEISSSPNPSRGDSHWISYDFGEVRKLQQGHFWNINNPDYFDDGARQIAVDYSLDGTNWNFWGIWDAPIANGSGFYEGVEGPDFEGLETRFILLTIINNHGGDCYGFAEIKFAVEASSATDDQEIAYNRMMAYPNPASDFTTLKLSSSYQGMATIELLDLNGKKIQSNSIELRTGEQEIPYEIETTVSGQYLIRLRTPHTETSTEISVIKNQ